jgi:hypothetical protein
MRPTSKTAYARLMVLRFVIVHAMATPRQMLDKWFANWSAREQMEFDESCKRRAETNISKMQLFGLWKYVSPNEKIFLQSYGSRMDEDVHKTAYLRLESVGILMWAFGYLEEWPKIDVAMNAELLESVPLEKVGIFSKYPNLLPKEEIFAKHALVELWHWRVRARQLIEKGRPFVPDENMKQEGLKSFDDAVRFKAKAAHRRGDLSEIIDEDFGFRGKSFRSLTAEEYQKAASIITERHYAMNWLCGNARRNRWDETPTDA